MLQKADGSGAMLKSMVLLDSGATHALRRARDEKEWERAVPTQVVLAEGVTTDLRLLTGTMTLLSAPGDECRGEEGIMTSAIIPMHELSAIGYQVKWNASGSSTHIQSPAGGGR